MMRGYFSTVSAIALKYDGNISLISTIGFQGPDRAFFLKMMDIFSTTDGYYKNSDENVYQELPSNDRPFQPQDRPRGEKIDIRPDMKSKKGDNNPEIKFDPKPAESACGVFLSVYTYCLDGTDVDMDCACYSSTYYVPDQFNGLATRCAKATSGCRSGNNNNRGGDDWCDVGSKVASYSAYCTPIDDDKPVKFGVTINASSTKASGPKPTPRETEDDDSPAPARQTTPSTPRTTRTSQTDAAAPVTITPAPTPAILQPPRSSAVVIFPSTTGRASRPLDVLLGSARLWVAFALSAAVAFN